MTKKSVETTTETPVEPTETATVVPDYATLTEVEIAALSDEVNTAQNV